MRAEMETIRSRCDDDPRVHGAGSSPSTVGATLRSIARELDVIDITAPRIMPQMLPRISGALGLERMLAYGLRREGSGWGFDFVDSCNLAAREVRAGVASINEILREAPALPLFDPAHLEPVQRNIVCVLPPPRALVADGLREWGPPETRTARTALAARLLTAMEPWHLADAHCARVLLCDGAQFLGWVGGYHPEPIPPVTVARFRRLVPALRRRLRAERLLGLVAGPVDAMIVAALGHVAAPAWVTDLQGRVLAANEAGRAHYDRDPGTTQALLRRPKTAEGAPRVAIHEMNQRGMPALRLVVLESAPPRPESAVPAFAAQHRLTARQTEVLALLVTGASNINIAATLGCTERTVETHLAAIFRRLGCMSRTELVGRVLLSDRENT